MRVSLGPDLTERQERQREATERAARILREAGIDCKVTYLMAGEKWSNSDSAMLTVGPHGRA